MVLEFQVTIKVKILQDRQILIRLTIVVAVAFHEFTDAVFVHKSSLLAIDPLKGGVGLKLLDTADLRPYSFDLNFLVTDEDEHVFDAVLRFPR